jgi:hypothetical protein
MAKGGGTQTQTTTSQPWDKAQPGLMDAMGQAKTAFNNPQFMDYLNKTYGGGNLNMGNVSGAINGLLTGSGGLGGLTSGNQAGANSALGSMLAGKPDYAGVNANANAADAATIQNFNQNVIPGLNSHATFLNNGTGGIKTLSADMPAMAAQMAASRQGALEAERQRALQGQQTGLGMYGQFAGQQGQQQLGASALFPQLSQQQMMPVTGQQQQASQYAQLMAMLGGSGGTQTQQMQGRGGSTFGNVLGGGLAGYGATGSLWGAGAGGLAGLFG